jgi:hypothetical protein
VLKHVCSTSGGADAADHHEVLWGASVGMTPIPVRCRLNCICCVYTGWCPYGPWTTCFQACSKCYTSCLTETLLQSLKHNSVWMTWTSLTQTIFLSSSITRLLRFRGLTVSQYSSCLYSMISLWLLCLKYNLLCMALGSTAVVKYVILIDGMFFVSWSSQDICFCYIFEFF